MNLKRIITLSFVASLVAVSAMSQAAVVFLWPKDNGIVRESVNVAIDPAGVPQGGYVNFSLNDSMITAVGFTRAISGGRQAYTWLWDTREPVRLGPANQDPARPEDGVYTITAKAMSAAGEVVGQGSVKVRLSNKVSSISASTPINLNYSRKLGDRERYQVRLGVTVAEIGGAAINSNQEVQVVSFTGQGSVDDLQSGGAAMMRYRPLNSNLQLYGKAVGPVANFEKGSLYQLINRKGRVLETNPYSTVGFRLDESFAVDFRTPLPYSAVKVGDQWSSPIGVSMPAIGTEIVRADATFTAEGLEWAGGKECVRIGIRGSGSTTVLLAAAKQSLSDISPADPGSETATTPMPSLLGLLGPPPSAAGGATPGMPGGGTPARVDIQGTDWFSFRTGELVRRELTVDLNARMDSADVQKLNEGLGLSSVGGSAPVDQSTGAYENPEDYLSDYSKAMGSILRPGAGGGLDTSLTSVKLRVNLSAKKIN